NMFRQLIRSSLIAMLLGVMAVPSLKAQPEWTRQTVDSLRACLSEARTPADSLPILNNLFDILPRAASNAISDTVYHVALRAGKRSDALDIIRSQANRYMRSDSMLKVLADRAASFPESPERSETITFIKMMDNSRRAHYSDNDVRRATIRDYLARVQTLDPNDIYERVALTHGICMMLSDEPNADLLLTYMDSLSALIKRLPPNAVSLRSAYNIHSAAIYASSHPDRAMVADMLTLNDIEQLKRYYRDKGRNFKDYSSSYYTIYSRLLSNFAVLDTAKVEEYYAEALKQLPNDPAIKRSYELSPYPDIFREMFYKRYAKALPLIRKVLANDRKISRPRRTLLLQYELECAKALGDKNAMLDAYEAYTESLYEELKERTHSAFRELKTAYALYDMKYQMGELEADSRASVASMERKIIIISIIAILVLAALVVVLYIYYRKNRLLADNLVTSNKRLVLEGENLRQSRAELIRAREQAQKANNLKSDFIKNMTYEVRVPLQAINEYSHLIADSVSGSDTGSATSMDVLKHLGRFADLVEFNSELLNTIIDDVFRLTELESDSMPLHCQVINLRSLCESAVSSAAHRVDKGVTMKVAPECGRLDVFSDPTRVSQVLNNLLTNAAKFTHQGSITVSYHLDEATNRVSL
ncbi:MAG: HAMP domain-containing histidine kinase, partial [Duncaniella sp.]|nr:HAMP domain-containing histidine kinase [Duncaniella sp.]